VLRAAASWLIDRCDSAEQDVADLSGHLVVLPGRAAGQRLMELLIEEARRRRLALVPPRTTTPGDLPEFFYTPGKPLTDTVLETLCWAGAIATATERDRALVAPGLEATEPDGVAGDRLVDTAAGIVSLHRELAAHGLGFAGFAAAAEAKLPAFGDHDRWKALTRLEERYLAWLRGLDRWDRQTARRKAIENHEVHCARRIVLVATVDLDPLQRSLLAALPEGCDALLAAPATMGDAEIAAAFDPFGCIVPAAWELVPIPIPLERIVVVEDAEGQADAIVDWLHCLDGQFAADEITIAAPDAALIPELEQRLRAVGLTGRAGGGGRTVQRSTPWQLLDAILDWIAIGEFPSFAHLLRCPDAARLLGERAGVGLPSAVADEVARRHLPLGIDRDLLSRAAAGAGAAEGQAPAEARFLALLGAADDWLADLRAACDGLSRRLPRKPATGSQPTGRATAWAAAVRGVMRAALGERILDRSAESERTVVVALESLGDALAEVETLPDELAAAAGPRGLGRLLLAGWGRRPVPPLPDAGALPIVGWLEVALDDAPALAVTSAVEGVLPGGAGRDPLLPDPLRQALGLPDTGRTAARDAWSLALAATCREALLVVVPRQRVDGAAAVPSRLLFRRHESELVAAVRRLCAAPAPVATATELPTAVSRIPVPAPDSIAAVLPPRPLVLRVTAFRDYIACPYRFWLRHRLRLGSSTDDQLELGPADFGTLVHHCLDRFATDPGLAAATDAGAIGTALTALLDSLVAARYGPAALPAVRIQAALARRRLLRFATKQAERAADGWRIVASEQDVMGDHLVVDRAAVRLAARFDRVDHHPASGRWQILDYKTSATARTPEQIHFSRGEWVDLQLPLYKLLAPHAAIPGLAEADVNLVDVGFFNLPARTEETDVKIAGWTADDHAAALAKAHEVVRGIRAGRFWPPVPEAARSFPEFDAICQTHAILDGDEGDEGEPP
jgi:RecB family exonuclease